MKITQEEGKALVQGLVEHLGKAPKGAAKLKKVLLTLSEDLHRKLRHRCIDEDLTMSELVEKALVSYLAKP